MSEFLNSLIFQPKYDPLTIILDIFFTAVVLTSYLVVMTNKKSIFVKLMEVFDSQKSIDIDFKEIKEASGRMAMISTTLAGISLATIALLANLLNDRPNQIEAIVGGGWILSSSMLFFWALGLCFNATISTDVNKARVIKAFRRGYWLVTFGVFLFFSGLLWVLSSVNIWLAIIPFLVYVVILSVMTLHPVKDDAS